MNPKISITVDAKNKATAVVSGIASVGAKIDVEVTGLLATNIPNWGAADDFTGPSLRFRLVDECGHDLVRFPIHKKTETSPDAWTESSNVFSATNVDFDTDVLRKAFCGVSFNEKMEFGVILDSIVDKAEYATGRMKVSQWRVASTEDPTVLPDWRETLAKLTVDLASVEVSKTAASASATAASSSASAASASASAASGYANTASSSSSSASNSAMSASNSATSASASATAAATSAGNAETAVLNYPRINQSNKHWERYVDGSWVDSGVVAEGVDGQDGDAATISVGTVSTGAAGTNASVTNVGTSSAAVFDFTIPRGANGANGTNARATVTQTASGAVITCQTGSEQPTTATVTNGAQGVPASVVQVMNPVTGEWHYLYARVDSQNHVVLSLEQTGSSRDVGYIVPQGGTTGQVLKKNSSIDYDVGWSLAGSGDVTGATMNGASVTKGSDGVLAFGTVLTNAAAFDSAGTASSAIATHLSDTAHQHVTGSEKSGWSGKQDALEYDAQPTEDSVKMVKSGGIFAWVKGLLPSWLTSSYAEPATVSSVNEKYKKPTGGIPSTDLATDVQSALTNARTPTTHAASHASGGDDAITPENIGAMESNVTHLSGDVANLDVSTCSGLKVVATDPGTYTANVIYFIKASS